MSEVLADPADTVNDALEKRMLARKMLTNASYFAFTATPKNKTLEIFGDPMPPDAEGKVKHRLFHSYTMKPAIQVGFILDVLNSYTPVMSYYKLVKTIEGDPELDTRKAKEKLRRYVESHEYAIRLKAEIIVDHFHEQVITLQKIGGEARAMVVTGSIERAVQYYHAMRGYLEERKSPYRAIVAFSGEHEYGGTKVTETSLNGFSSNDIADRIQEEPTDSWFAPTSSGRATTSPCCTRCTWRSPSPASRRFRPFHDSTVPTPRSTTPLCSTS